MTTRPRTDQGFTLPEVLITTVIMGIIVTVLAGVFSVVLRNTPDAEARADDARSMLGLVTWLPQDVDSTPPTGFDLDPASDSDCGIYDTATNLLHMTWTEKVGPVTTTYIASYRYAANASGTYQLKRVTCSGTGSPPFANGSSQNLTSELPALPAGWAPGQAPVAVTFTPFDSVNGTPANIQFEITTIDGDIVRTDSAAKNPAETLPTTTLPSWYIPTPTTAVYTNTQAQTVSIPGVNVHPTVATNINLTVSDAEGDPILVELDPLTPLPLGWGVILTGTKLTVIPPLTDLGQTRVIKYKVDDLKGDPPNYGTVTMTVVTAVTSTTISPSTTTTTSTVAPSTTLPSCSVTGWSLSRTTIKNVQSDGMAGSVNVGVLQKDIIVSATTNGYCTGLEVRYESGGVNSPGFVGMTQTGTNTWSAMLEGKQDAGSSETWSDGPHPIKFHSVEGGPWGAVTLTVT